MVDKQIKVKVIRGLTKDSFEIKLNKIYLDKEIKVNNIQFQYSMSDNRAHYIALIWYQDIVKQQIKL